MSVWPDVYSSSLSFITDVYTDKGTLPNFDLSPDTLLQKLSKYRKIQKISPSKFKPPKLVTQKKNPPLNCPSEYKPPYFEITLKYKMKQSKNGAVTHKFLHLPENYYVCKMIAVKKFHSFLLFA